MFKMKKILLVGGALLLLAGCSKPAEPEFEQNEDPIVEGFTMYIIGSHWNNWDTKTIKEARDLAYKLCDNVHFKGAKFRKDIAYQALKNA